MPLTPSLSLPPLAARPCICCAGTLAGGLAPDELIITPNGVAFAPPSVRPGILPRLLREILETRIMVRGFMERVLIWLGAGLLGQELWVVGLSHHPPTHPPTHTCTRPPDCR